MNHQEESHRMITSTTLDAHMLNDFLDRELQDWMMGGGFDLPSLKSHQHEADPFVMLQEDAFSDPYPVSDSSMINMLDQHSRRNDLRSFLDYFTSEKKETPSAGCIQQKTAEQQQQPLRSVASIESMSEIDENEKQSQQYCPRFREYQDKQWDEQYKSLLNFIKKHGHCCVPNKCGENPRLGRWVKRQRYQYKLLQQNKQSTLTAARAKILEDVGFVWDSHSALWVERLNELKEFRKIHGHCNVPSSYPENNQLSTWVKCQRRQYKLFKSDKKRSNLNAERIAALETLGFEWDGRQVRASSGKQCPKS